MTFKEYVRTAFRWQRGRQNSGYDKLLLVTGTLPIPFDIYLLRFPEGSEIPEHRDPVEQGKHYRLNVILRKSRMGGEFKCMQPIWASRRINLFRSDISPHSVTQVTSGTRYVLSVGWLLR